MGNLKHTSNDNVLIKYKKVGCSSVNHKQNSPKIIKNEWEREKNEGNIKIYYSKVLASTFVKYY